MKQPPDVDAHLPARAVMYLPVAEAAHRLGLSDEALRARCRRHARRRGRDVVAELGGGIVAVKFGASWRLKFPD